MITTLKLAIIKEFMLTTNISPGYRSTTSTHTHTHTLRSPSLFQARIKNRFVWKVM